MSPILAKKSKIDFLSNIDYTLRQLYQFRDIIFKDYQKKLINSLIDFFEQYRKLKKGGAIHFKINYFDLNIINWRHTSKKLKKETFVWTVNNIEELKKIKKGQNIITDKPKFFSDLI